MANYFTNLFEGVGNWMAQRVAGYLNDFLGIQYGVLGNYYKGAQRKQLKTKTGAQDDNITLNFVGLAIDRSVSRLWRGDVKFQLPENAEQQEEYLSRVWELNKKGIFLYQIGLHGSVYGTFYYKIKPEAIIDPYTEELYPRLIAIDPEIIRVETSPEDMDEVERYKIEYTITAKKSDEQAETIGIREITRHAIEDDIYTDENGMQSSAEADTWQIERWEQVGSGPWDLVSSKNWPYSFPPILHGKNLPSLKSCYGASDIDNAINAQDKANFVYSNTGKIIKYHASPNTIGTGFSTQEMKQVENAPDTFWAIPNENAKVFNLEMGSDLGSSRAFGLDLRQSIFDMSREVDISSMADKLGALTNFGLQVLWSDAIDKNGTKRQLYGDALLEINRRLLVLAGYEGEESKPGSLQWGDALPINITEELQADKTALELGIIDKGSVAARYQQRYGKTWEEIQKALEAEQEQANKNNDNIGALILQNFIKSKNTQDGMPQDQQNPAEQPGQMPPQNQNAPQMMQGQANK